MNKTLHPQGQTTYIYIYIHTLIIYIYMYILICIQSKKIMKHHETLNSPVALKAGHLRHFRVFTLAPPLEHLWNGMDEKSCHHHLSGEGFSENGMDPQKTPKLCHVEWGNQCFSFYKTYHFCSYKNLLGDHKMLRNTHFFRSIGSTCN